MIAGERSEGDHPAKPTSVTQKDVARRAGVSISTVSYVLNNGPRSVSPEIRARVLEAIDVLGYRPNEYARRLIQQNWNVAAAPPRQFGVIVAGWRALLSRPFYSALIVGVLEEAARQDYALRFIHLYDDLHDPLLFNRSIHPDAVAGVVLIHFSTLIRRDHELLDKIVDRLGNVVCLDFDWPGLPSILFDRHGAGRRVVDYLIGLGHRRIGFVGNRDERFDGYLDSLRRHAIEFDPALATDDSASNSMDDGWRGAKLLLALSHPPSALFAVSDEVAIGALRAAREHGLNVPGDISIVGTDDIEMAAYTHPPLTTMRIPKAEMAAMAVRTLVERIARPDDLPINVTFPVTLIERGSSAAYRPG